MQMGVKFVCALAAVGLAWGMSMPAYGDPLTVKTAQGKAQGKTINDGKVKAFLGLPYAAPPVGEMRWKAPGPPAKWKGTRDATKFGARCAQGRIFEDMVFQDAGPSEDCLFLNVYAPADATDKSKLPVMFWIHGGGYAGGASSEPRHNGDFLPLKGVVLVTINYRLGVFGFLATSELAKEAGGTAGNYALMDMVAALQWVKGNIGKFGGDSSNVTIFGESAGSFAVSTLMAAPAAQGLFEKAIGESGGAFSDVLPVDSLADREAKDGDWVAGLGVNSLAELRALPTGKLLAAAKAKKGGFSTVVDGKLLTEPVPATYAAGKQADVPTLTGWNKGENGGSPNPTVTAAAFQAQAKQRYADRAEEFLKLYPAATDEQAHLSQNESSWDQQRVSTYLWARERAKTAKSNAYTYFWDHALPGPDAGLYGAFHSSEVPYALNTLYMSERPFTAADHSIADQVSGYWANFATTGDPNGKGLANWPAVGGKPETMEIGDKPGAIAVAGSAEKLAFWEKFLTK